MGRVTTIFYKRLTAILNEKGDSLTGQIGLHLSSALLKSLYCVYQEIDLLQSCLEMQLCMSLLIFSQNFQACYGATFINIQSL